MSDDAEPQIAETWWGAEARALFGPGWRGPEPWGVWGFGPMHGLRLPLPLGRATELEADVRAFLAGSQTRQRIVIRAGAEAIGEWNFTLAANREIRSVRIPTLPPGTSITFHPQMQGIPAELDKRSRERRPLGLGLHRFRLSGGPTAKTPV